MSFRKFHHSDKYTLRTYYKKVFVKVLKELLALQPLIMPEKLHYKWRLEKLQIEKLQMEDDKENSRFINRQRLQKSRLINNKYAICLICNKKNNIQNMYQLVDNYECIKHTRHYIDKIEEEDIKEDIRILKQ